jgi:hypothetical protein
LTLEVRHRSARWSRLGLRLGFAMRSRNVTRRTGRQSVAQDIAAIQHKVARRPGSNRVPQRTLIASGMTVR